MLRTLLVLIATIPLAQATNIAIGTDASTYGVLFEGGGSGKKLSLSNVTINGNIGVGGTGRVVFGTGAIHGALDFSAASSSNQYTDNSTSNVGPTSVNNSVARVTSALNTLNALNTTLGGAAGTNLDIDLNGSATLNILESAGALFTSGGVTYRVFNVTDFDTSHDSTILVVGDGSGNPVVFNFTDDTNFNNQVLLSGLTSDQVLWNFVGGSGLSGGPKLKINTKAGDHLDSEGARGIFLDPNGTLTVSNANIFGRVFGGDSHTMAINSGSTLNAPGPFAHNPEPSTIILLGTVLVGAVALVRRKQAGNRLS